jgi:hypothetical protein
MMNMMDHLLMMIASRGAIRARLKALTNERIDTIFRDLRQPLPDSTARQQSKTYHVGYKTCGAAECR